MYALLLVTHIRSVWEIKTKKNNSIQEIPIIIKLNSLNKTEWFHGTIRSGKEKGVVKQRNMKEFPGQETKQ